MHELYLVSDFTGYCELSLSNGDEYAGDFVDSEREGFGCLKFGLINKAKFGVVAIRGNYSSDQLQGLGSITYANGDKLVCNFLNGVPNGPAKLFGENQNIKQVRDLHRKISRNAQ